MAADGLWRVDEKELVQGLDARNFYSEVSGRWLEGLKPGLPFPSQN